jgi:hypothetical protein
MSKPVSVYSHFANPAVDPPKYHCSLAWADTLERDGAIRKERLIVILAPSSSSREHLRDDSHLASRSTPATISASESQLNTEYRGSHDIGRMAAACDRMINEAIRDRGPIPRKVYQTLAAAKTDLYQPPSPRPVHGF